MNIIFFFTVLITILYILEILAFFNKKQTLLLDNKWVILLATFMISGLWTVVYMKTNENVIKIQSDIVQDFNNDNIHDSTCNCGYCMDLNADYYLNLGVMDTNGNYNIYLIRPEDNDTIANLSSVKLLYTIIDEDNL